MKNLYKIIATGFYTGYLPFAPGTWGTLVGVLIFWLIGSLPPLTYLVSLIGIIFIAIWAADHAAQIFGEKDPQKVVIDEIAGYLVAVAFFKPTIIIMVAGFILFRFFDIVKPAPVNWMEEKFRGGVGIVMDDVMAGIYANLVLHILIYLDMYLKFNVLKIHI